MKQLAAYLTCCIIAAWLCATGLRTAAQTSGSHIIRSTRLGVEDGLISNVVLCGLQDSRGFIWFGTTEGLQRYDGASFILFTKEKGGLQGNKVGQMVEDRDGRLWLHYGSSNEALLRSGRHTDLLELTTNKVQSLSYAFGTKLPFPAQELKWLFADAQRNVFLITGENELWMYRGGGSFKKLLSRWTADQFYPHGSLYQAWGSAAWLSGDTELVRVDTLGNVLRVSGGKRLNANCVFHLSANGDCLAIATPSRENPGKELNLPACTYTVTRDGKMLPAPISFFGKAMLCSPGEYLIEYRADVRTRGVMLHNPHIGLRLLTDTGIISLMDSAALNAEPPLSPYAYFTDRLGGHWLCTSLGVFHFRIAPAYFTNYLTRAQLPAATAVAAQARGIWDDGSGNLFAGRDALYRLADSGKSVTQLTKNHPMLVQGDSQYIWFSHDRTLSRIRRDGSGITHIALSLSTGRELWCYYNSRNGRRYIGGDGYIGYLSGDSAVSLKAMPGADPGSTCYQFIETADGQLLAVTSNGIFEIRGDVFIPYNANLPSKRLHYIHDDGVGNWWLCTAGDGLVRWNRSTGRVSQYGIDQGMPSNVLYGCLPDHAGNLWISSNNGLIRFNPQTSSIRTFTKKDGIPHNEFNRISFFKSKLGRLYFGGLNGITAFYPDAIPDDTGSTFNAPLQLISLQQVNTKEGKLVDKLAAFSATGSIEVEPDDRFLALSVRMLDYAPGIHRYDYRVEGLDTMWRSSGDGTIRLEQLPYGTFTLHIRGQNPEGAWSSEELRIPLHVRIPFYRRQAFIIAVFIAGILLVLLAIRARVHLLQRTNQRLERTIVQRTHELRQSLAQKDVLMKEIHHRVKNNLQVISALQQMQATRSNDPQVKAALEDAQNRVLSIAFIHHNLYQHDDLKGVQMQSFVRELAGHILDIYATAEKRITVADDIESITLDIDTAVPIGLVINELLTNSFKHAFNGRRYGVVSVWLRSKGEGTYLLEYEDDGRGLDPGIDFKQVGSLGLRLISQLTEQLDGNMSYSRGEKSRFTLTFQDFERRNAV